MLLSLPCWFCVTHLAFFDSLPLCTLAYMFMHESMCHPYPNLMELWTPDPNLHLSFQDTLFCLITCLFALFGIFYQLVFQHAFLLFVSLLVCWLVSFVIACTRMEHGHLEQGCNLLGAKKNSKDVSKKMQAHKGQCSVDQGTQPLMSGFLFLSLSKPLLQSMYQGSPSFCTHYFSYSLLGPRSLGMRMSVLHFLYLAGPYPWSVGNISFTFLLCMIALCMMYMYIYIYACMCVGDRALCMMDSYGYVSDPLQP